MPTARTAACLTWERPSVSIRWRPPPVVAIVTHLVTRLGAGFGLTAWMQTTGAALLTVKRCSLAWVQSAAQDGHGVGGLLYLAAVPADWREQEHRQETVDTDPSLVRHCHSVGYRRSPGLWLFPWSVLVGRFRMPLWSGLVVRFLAARFGRRLGTVRCPWSPPRSGT